MTKFAERLKEERETQGLNQRQLGEIMAVNQRTISSWEKAVREPDYDTLVKIALFFGVSTDYLLGLEN